MPDIKSQHGKTLAVVGAFCGAVVGYLKAQWIVAGSYLLLFLLCGGDSMKDMNGFFKSVIATYAVSICGFILIGALIGYKIGKIILSPRKLLAAVAVFCLFTGAVWRTHSTPWQSEQKKTAAVGAKFYDTDGYKKVTDAELRVKGRTQGWELFVKTAGARSGIYWLICSVTQDFKSPDPKRGVGSAGLFYRKIRLDLAAGEHDTTVTIPSKEMAEKYRSEMANFARIPGLQPAQTRLEVYLEADLPSDSEYYGSQWMILEKKRMDISLKDIGIAR